MVSTKNRWTPCRYQAELRRCVARTVTVHPSGTVDDDEVMNWLDVRIPVIRGAAKLHSEWRDLPQRYEMWSSGGYTERALSLVAAK